MLTFSHIYNFPALGPGDEDNEAPDLKSELRVVNDVFWIRLCAMGDLGFAEAYMYGDVECDDLVSIFQVSSSQRYRKWRTEYPIDIPFQPREFVQHELKGVLSIYPSSEVDVVSLPEHNWKFAFEYFSAL